MSNPQQRRQAPHVPIRRPSTGWGPLLVVIRLIPAMFCGVMALLIGLGEQLLTQLHPTRFAIALGISACISLFAALR